MVVLQLRERSVRFSGGVRGEVFVRIPPRLIAAGILVAVIFACRGDDSFQRGAGDLPVSLVCFFLFWRWTRCRFLVCVLLCVR